jgi:hypothetical protein
MRRIARHGAFGRTAATVLAAGVPLLVAAHLPAVPVGAYVLLAPVAALLALAAVPLLRERGLLSLALVTAVASGPTIAALRQARFDARAAAPVRAAQAATAPEACGSARVALLLDADLDPTFVRALPLALRPPFVDDARDVIAARADSMAGRWLLRMELPAFVLSAAGIRPAPPAGLGARLDRPTLAVRAGLDRTRAEAALWIRCEGGGGGLAAVVYTPLGEETVALWDPAQGIPADEQRRLGRWLAPLPSGLPIRILVVAPATADAYGWTELRT